MAGTAILECLRASYVDFLGEEIAIEFSQIGFVRPLFIPDQGVEFEIAYTPVGDRHRVEVRSRPIGLREDWTVNTVGFAAPAQPSATTPKLPVSIPQDISEIDPQYTASGDFEKGPRWSCVTGIKIDGDTMWSRVSLNPDYLQDLELFGLHPAMFDRALNDPHGKPDGVSRVPYAIGRISHQSKAR